MKIIKPYARLLPLFPWIPDFTEGDGIDQIRKIEWFARISHRAEDAQTDVSWKRFIPFVVMEKGDWSVVEHGVVSVDFMVDRGITHEIVRHRLFSFTQESTRFVNYAKKIEPSFIAPFALGTEGYETWFLAIQMLERAYKELLSVGKSPQLARSVFPNSLASRIGITGNLRNWRHFMLMRTTAETHPQMREVTIPLLFEFKAKIPILFDDIEPDAKQSDNLKKMK